MTKENKKPILEVSFLSKDFQQTVLESISFKVYPNEFLSILGLSGNGKTTLLKCLAGLTKPTRGHVRIFPHEYSKDFGFVFQDTCLLPWLTVRENVEVGVSHLNKKKREEAVDQWLSNLGINSLEDNYPNEIQAAMRQKVNIGRALVSDPMCVLLDQPFSNLDGLTAKNFRDELLWLWLRENRKPSSFILTTNNIDEAVQLSDRILLMAITPGRIHQEIVVNLKRPRDSNNFDFQKTVEYVEKLFGALHLDQTPQHDHKELSLQSDGSSPSKDKVTRVNPLSPSDPSLVEGLLSRLEETETTIDIYDLGDELGVSFDEVLPAVVCAEQFGFVYTPGTEVGLTPFGQEYVKIDDLSQKRQLMKDTCLKIPLIDCCVQLVKEEKEDGLSKSDLMDYIQSLLPHEDAQTQFQNLIVWTQYTEVLSFDSSENRVFFEFEEEEEKS
jgi:NitT/TauT family transport system ATP-binding protein